MFFYTAFQARSLIKITTTHMKLLSIIISCLFIISCVNAKDNDVSNNILENFSDATKYAYLNPQCVALASDGSEIQIDTTKSSPPQNTIFSTNVGLLKSGQEYSVLLRYEIDNPNYTKQVNMKLIATAGVKKIAERHLFASKKSSFESMTFVVPEGAEDATITLEANGKFVGKIRNFRVVEGNRNKFLQATENAENFDGEIKNLPTGAKDFEVEQPKPATELVINATDFGMNEKNQDNFTALSKAIEECRAKKASKLVVNKGVYKFKTEKSVEISNLSDFTFDGGGSTFVFYRNEDKGACINVENCLRVKVGNFNIDYDWETAPLACVGEVIGSGESPAKKKFRGNTFSYYVDFKLVDYEKYPYYGKQVRIASIDAYDLNKRAVGVENAPAPIYIGLAPNHSGTLIEWISPNIIRVYLISACVNRLAKAKHKYYQLQHYYYGVGGLRVCDNKHLTLENINIYSCKGHGVLCTGSQQYWQMLNVNIASPKGKPERIVTSTSDLVHFARSNGYFKMIGCELSRGSDDCINIHDGTAFALWNSPNSIKMRNRGGNVPEIGDTVELRHSDYSSSGFKNKVVQVKQLKKPFVEVFFCEKIPEPKFDGFIMLNRKFDSSNVIIKDTYFHRNRARGALILTSDVTIENCRFENIPMGAIRIETGYTERGWCEGFGVKNVVVRNCTFDSSNVVGTKFNDIPYDVSCYAYMRRYETPEQPRRPVLSDILFEGNTFKNSFGGAILVSSVKNGIFKDNKFENSVERETKEAWRGACFVRNSRDIKFINNQWIKSQIPTKTGAFYDIDTTKKILFNGNSIK